MLIWFALGLEIVELFMAVEEAFDIEIPDEEATDIDAVGLLYILVCDKIGLDPTAAEAEPTQAGWTQGKVWDILCAIIHQQFRVPKRKIHFDTRFVDDLGMG